MKHFIRTALAATIIAAMSSAYAAPTVSTPNAKSNLNITPAERAKIEEVVHEYLMNKPEIIIEAVQNYQKKQYEQAELTVKQTQDSVSTFATPLFKQSNDPVAGNPNGKVTVVEFFDYQCGHCVQMAPVISAIIKENPEVRVVFKEFPIRGPISEFAARAALAANKQGKYFDFSHALLTSDKPLTEALIIEIAQKNGLDVDKLKKDMEDNDVKTHLKENIKLAQDLKLFGTPAFFVGATDAKGKIEYIPGRLEQKQMQETINKYK